MNFFLRFKFKKLIGRKTDDNHNIYVDIIFNA